MIPYPIFILASVILFAGSGILVQQGVDTGNAINIEWGIRSIIFSAILFLTASVQQYRSPLNTITNAPVIITLWTKTENGKTAVLFRSPVIFGLLTVYALYIAHLIGPFTIIATIAGVAAWLCGLQTIASLVLWIITK